MNQSFEKQAEEAAAFQKIWMESASRLMQAAFTLSPNTPPPEILRQMRAGILQALADSWNEFMRSPQFLDGMRQWMENAIAFRKLSNDFMGHIRNETQGPSRADIDTIMITVRHMEKRLLDRVDELSARVGELNERLEGQSGGKAKGRGRTLRPKPTRGEKVGARTNGKTNT